MCPLCQADRLAALKAEVSMLRSQLRAADDRALMREQERDRSEAALAVLKDDICMAANQQPLDADEEHDKNLLALVAQNVALRAQIEKGLDYEHHSSCGHVWTMRHTACPECFTVLRADLARATAVLLSVQPLEDHRNMSDKIVVWIDRQAWHEWFVQKQAT
jgi:hypothetical protein